MDLADEVELDFLEITGDIEIAQAVAQLFLAQLEAVSYLCGLPMEWFYPSEYSDPP